MTSRNPKMSQQILEKNLSKARTDVNILEYTLCGTFRYIGQRLCIFFLKWSNMLCTHLRMLMMLKQSKCTCYSFYYFHTFDPGKLIFYLDWHHLVPLLEEKCLTWYFSARKCRNGKYVSWVFCYSSGAHFGDVCLAKKLMI